MSEQQLKLPSGKVIPIKNIPPGVSKEEIKAKLISAGVATEEDFLPQTKPAAQPEPSMVDRFNTTARSYIEPALTVATSAIAEPIAGAAGLLTSLTPGTEPGSGAGVVEGVRENLTYQPRLPESQANLQAVGETIQPVVEPVSDAVNAMADYAFQVTGSPTIAATVKTAPVAISEALGLGVIRKIKGGVRLLKADGQPTKALENALNKHGLVYENLSPETKAMIPVEAERNLIPGGNIPKNTAEKALITQLQSGGRDGALAPLMLEGQNIVTDVGANAAIKQGWREGTVQMAKTMNATTRKLADQMLNKRWRLLKNETLSNELRPLDVVGDSFNKRIDFILDKANTARKELNTIARTKLKGVYVDTRPVVDELFNSLDDLGVKYTTNEFGVPSVNYTGSIISKNKNAQKVINDAIDLMRENRPDAYGLHQFKRQMDDLIDFKKKSKGGLPENGRRVLKSLRHVTNQQLRQSIPRYAEVNDVLSKTLNAMDDFKAATKIDVNFYEDPSSRIGQSMRKIHSNYAVRGDMEDALSKIDKWAGELGGKFDDNYSDLVMFANRLDERFGASSGNTFQGLNESAIRSTAFNGPTQGAKEFILNKAMEKGEHLLGVNDFNAYTTMRDILRRKAPVTGKNQAKRGTDIIPISP